MHGEWEKIETAPKNGAEVLLWLPYLKSISGGRFKTQGVNGAWVHEWDGAVFSEGPTHWMPLPDPPKERA